MSVQHRTSSQIYAEAVARKGWIRDPAQVLAVAELDRIHAAFVNRTVVGPLRRWWLRLRGAHAPQGLYLWGSVGRGKTLMTEVLIESLPDVRIIRKHFHRFMVDLHTQMKTHSGQSDTVALVASQIAQNSRVLVLDEFFVADIADAMILGRLLDQLFIRGVVLVTTSNIPPENLYKDGLQRARFLPAIDLLHRHCVVHALESPNDYRLRQLTSAETYLTPLGAQANSAIEAHVERLAIGLQRQVGLEINGREIPCIALSEGLLWISFDTACRTARSSADFVEIARDFHTVVLSDVPILDDQPPDAIRRLVYLIDALYDHNVNLIISAAAQPGLLYTGTKFGLEWQRAASRLNEMRSLEYLARGHQP